MVLIELETEISDLRTTTSSIVGSLQAVEARAVDTLRNLKRLKRL